MAKLIIIGDEQKLKRLQTELREKLSRLGVTSEIVIEQPKKKMRNHKSKEND